MEESRKLKNDGIEEIRKPKKDKSIFSLIAFYLALLPFALVALVFLMFWGDAMQGAGWIILTYFMTVGLPIMAISLILGIIGIKSNKKIFSYIAIGATLVLAGILVYLLFF